MGRKENKSVCNLVGMLQKVRLGRPGPGQDNHYHPHFLGFRTWADCFSLCALTLATLINHVVSQTIPGLGALKQFLIFFP